MRPTLSYMGHASCGAEPWPGGGGGKVGVTWKGLGWIGSPRREVELEVA